MSRTRNVGQQSERLAADFLRRQGYTIVTTNWHCPYGELDIVAQKDDTLVFVEVRSRHAQTTDAAFESIGPRKRTRLLNAAQAYVAAQERDDIGWRIDVIAVALQRGGSARIDHLENALDW